MADLYDEAAAQEWDDPVGTFHLRRGQLAQAAARGHRDDAERHLHAIEGMAAALRQPRLEFGARMDRAMMAAFTGDLAAAEQGTLEAMGYGLDTGMPQENVMGPVGAVLYMTRRAQGRPDELVGSIETLVETQPGAPVWRIALAGALSESERVDEARIHMEWLTERNCANVPPDVEYPVTLCGIARLTRTVPLDEATMAYVYEHLLPFAGTYNWSGTSITDANDHGLAVLSARRGDVAASDAHFAAAMSLAERAGARPYLATAHLDHARLLAERDERATAADHARIALGIGEEIGMDGPFGVVRHARELLASIDG
jgi:hypothetical protein